MKQPVTLTTKVPHGNAPLVRSWTSRRAGSAAGAPTAAATRNAIQATRAHALFAVAADVLDDFDVVEDDESFGDELVELRAGRR